MTTVIDGRGMALPTPRQLSVHFSRARAVNEFAYRQVHGVTMRGADRLKV